MFDFFDQVARTLAGEMPRRQALARVGGLFAGAALGVLGLGGRAAAETLPNCNKYCRRFRNLNDYLSCRTTCTNCPSTDNLCGTTAANLVCCTGLANGTAACVADSCRIVCNAGFADCDGQIRNGCETNLNTSVTNCGACGNACPSANATPICTNGTCGFVCNAGFGDCNAIPADGCETDLRSNVDHCGGCGIQCPTPPNTSRTCTSGTCGFVCNTGFADCDGFSGNGCEVNLQTDVTNCGGCGIQCPTPANASRTCQAGVCGFICKAGFADCNANSADGCEVNLLTDNNNCGGCGIRCAGGKTCVNGVCQ